MHVSLRCFFHQCIRTRFTLLWVRYFERCAYKYPYLFSAYIWALFHVRDFSREFSYGGEKISSGHQKIASVELNIPLRVSGHCQCPPKLLKMVATSKRRLLKPIWLQCSHQKSQKSCFCFDSSPILQRSFPDENYAIQKIGVLKIKCLQSAYEFSYEEFSHGRKKILVRNHVREMGPWLYLKAI